MPETISLTLLAVAGTLLGVALGIVGTYFVSIRLARNHAKALAGLRLRDAFAPEVVKIQHLEDEEFIQIPDILEVAFEKHHMAANEFVFFLDKVEAQLFIKTWREYCANEDANGTDFYQYAFDRDTAIGHIYKVLEFTKYIGKWKLKKLKG